MSAEMNYVTLILTQRMSLVRCLPDKDGSKTHILILIVVQVLF